MNTKYTTGWAIYFETSSDGRSWDKPVVLYFTNKTASQVWRMPYVMDGETARPELVNP